MVTFTNDIDAIDVICAIIKSQVARHTILRSALNGKLLFHTILKRAFKILLETSFEANYFYFFNNKKQFITKRTFYYNL